MVIVSIVILIVILGVLITVHELGHFATAKLTGVKVNEFAIGMGPKIFKRQKGETLYSLRAFPIGGFCAMEGEDDNSLPDPRAFGNRPLWARFLVLVAGSGMNFIIGFLIFVIAVSSMTYIGEPNITSFAPEFAFEGEAGFQAGDRITAINGHPIYVFDDVGIFLALGEGNLYDFTLLRDGRTVNLENLPLQKEMMTNEDGTQSKRFGFDFGDYSEKAVGTVLREAWLQSIDMVRLVKVSIGELIAGRAGFDQLQGPVGMGAIVDDIVQAPNVPIGLRMSALLQLAALLAVNLAVMNLLPLPALDGGRILFLLIELIRRKKMNPKVEGYVHAAGFVLVIGLMVFIFYNDIARLVT